MPAIAITKGLKDQTTAPGEKACLQIELNTIPRQIKWLERDNSIQIIYKRSIMKTKIKTNINNQK